jgi:hypothetical protein
MGRRRSLIETLHPRHDAPMPSDRCPPFLLLPGVGGRAPLVTPFAKRSRGLSNMQRAAIDRIVARIPGSLPTAPFWIDAETGATSRCSDVRVRFGHGRRLPSPRQARQTRRRRPAACRLSSACRSASALSCAAWASARARFAAASASSSCRLSAATRVRSLSALARSAVAVASARSARPLACSSCSRSADTAASFVLTAISSAAIAWAISPPLAPRPTSLPAPRPGASPVAASPAPALAS